jgi:hypothetical protein
MTKSKTLVECYCGAKDKFACTFHTPHALCKHIDQQIVRTHQDTEVQRLRDVIERCRDAFEYICDDSDTGMVAVKALTECNAVLEDKK